MSDEDLRYPVGRLKINASSTAAERAERIRIIEEAPGALRDAVAGLTDEQLDTPYREGGWTVRQVVHHVPDSHVNAYIRMCLALTEDNPTVRPYDETAWAKLPYAMTGDIAVSLDLLDKVHERWMHVLRPLGDAEYARPYMHPDNGPGTLDGLLQVYAWHSRHHVAHITSLRARRGW